MTKVLCLDPGHGGQDPGAVANGLYEKNITLDIVGKVASKLSKYDVTIYLTRTDDTYYSVSQRAVIANNNKADYFLSIHVNAGGGTGFESFVYNGGVSSATTNLRATLHKAIMESIAAFGIKDRGMKAANLGVLRESNMPACLIECLFIDTLNDAQLLKQDMFLDQLADGIVKGLVVGMGLKLKTPTVDPLVDALKVLQNFGVVSSPEYWTSYGKANANVASLILKMANKLKEMA